MRVRRAAVGVALVAMVVAAGCSGRGGGADTAGGGAEAQVAPADAAASAKGQAVPATKPGSTGAAAQVRLVDLGNRIVRTATVDLEVDKGQLNETINRASDAVVDAL